MLQQTIRLINDDLNILQAILDATTRHNETPYIACCGECGKMYVCYDNTPTNECGYCGDYDATGIGIYDVSYGNSLHEGGDGTCVGFVIEQGDIHRYCFVHHTTN